ncbi:methyl-accepting chemotaxis protein [Alkalibacterium sp. 20]|uniref:methyl-accepting chemotaxis protein n=1 Tax=Alkalibacterium sp. 20 TaxID=1798803 RepID=UPI0009001DC6|nr:methyl-accepting chemotaxis protein [Alkalibacterium sp. 20]OJF92717.1 hypothetical protein AX762_09710 [Alkalibacterium sp. 20]
MESTLSKKNKLISTGETLNFNMLNSISLKLILIISFAFMVSAPIAQRINTIVAESDLIEGNIGAYINTAINILIINLILFFFMNRMIIRPLKLHIERLRDISEGNIRNIEEVKGKGEFSKLSLATNTTVTKLNKLIKEVQVSSNQTTEISVHLAESLEMIQISSREITKTIEEIAGGASDQAVSTEQGALKVSKLGEIIEKDNQYMGQLNQDFQIVMGIVESGLLEMEKLNKINESTNLAINEVKAVINETNKSAEQIENASYVISDIAEQTNLLALNAAIEAARAGETGKGFAVVAEEIRKLAEKSNTSTKEINDMVNNLQDNSKTMVLTMDKVINTSMEQSDGVTNSQSKFADILNAVKKSEKVFIQLNNSGEEMQQMKNEIVETIQNLSAIAEENSASTEETIAIVEEQNHAIETLGQVGNDISDSADKLNATISVFHI